MSLVHQFEYLRPKTLDEAIGILSEKNRQVQVLAGGTDLIPWIGEELVRPDVLMDIKGLGELAGITTEKDGLIIGALTTFTELIDSAIVREKLPLLNEIARAVASPGIRNRGTLVGNICSAVPSCDSGPALLVYEAEVCVRGPGGKRRIAMANWFLGPKRNALRQGELATGVIVPLPGRNHGGCYVKLGRYRGEDLAQASVAALALPGHHYRIAFGAVAPVPMRASKIEALIDGNEITDAIIAGAQALVSDEIAPITDIRATEQYRMHMIRVMLERGLKAAESRLCGTGPAYGASLI